MLSVSKNGNWKMYWGDKRLPQGSIVCGTIKDGSGKIGALIKLLSGVYVRGNGGGITHLPQDEVENALNRSAVLSEIGRIKSPKRAAASVANGQKGGRPKGTGKKRGKNVVA
jgi:hypothetical protein